MTPVKQFRIVEQRELVLANACADLVKELKLIEPTTYALFFNTGNMSAIYQTITGIIENHFASGTMNFACTGECIIPWEETPVVSIDLEFEKDEIFAFFRLFFGNKGTAVNLHHVSFGEQSGSPEENTRMLEKRLDQACISSHR